MALQRAAIWEGSALILMYPFMDEAIRDVLLKNAILKVTGAVPARYAPELMNALTHMPGKHVKAICDIVQSVGEWDWKGAFLTAMAPAMPDACLDTTLSIVDLIPRHQDRIPVLASIVERLPRTLLPRAFAIANKPADGVGLVRSLLGVEKWGDEAQRIEWFRTALSAARGLTDYEVRAGLIQEIVLRMPEDSFREEMYRASGRNTKNVRIRTLGHLVSHLPTDAFKEFIGAVAGWSNEDGDIECLKELCRFAPEKYHNILLRMLIRIDDHALLASCLDTLVPRINCGTKMTVAPMIQNELKRLQQYAGDDHLDRIARLFSSSLSACIDSSAWDNIIKDISALRDVRARILLLCAALPHLQVKRRVDVARAQVDNFDRVSDKRERAFIVTHLAPFIPQPQNTVLLRLAIGECSHIDDGSFINSIMGRFGETYTRTRCARDLEENLEDNTASVMSEFGRAVATVSKHCSDYGESAMQKGLLDIMSKPDWSRLLNLVASVRADGARAAILRDIAHLLPSSFHSDSLDLVGRIRRPTERAKAVGALANSLTGKSKENAFDLACDIPGEEPRVNALLAMAGTLPVALVGKALEVAFSLSVPSYSRDLGNALSVRMTEEHFTSVLNHIDKLDDDNSIYELFMGVVDPLPRHLRPRLLENAARIEDSVLLGKVLSKIFRTLDDSGKTRALGLVRAVSLPSVRETFIREVLDEAPESLVPLILSMAPRYKRSTGRMKVLIQAAARRGTEPVSEIVTRETLAILDESPSDPQRCSLLRAVIPRTPPAHFPDVVRHVREIRDDGDRALVLGLLSEFVPEHEFAEVFREAITCVQEAPKNRRQSLLSSIAHTTSSRMRDAVIKDVIRSTNTLALQFDLYVAFRPALSLDTLRNIMSYVMSTDNDQERAHCIESIAPLLPEQLSGELLGIAEQIGDKQYRSRAIASVAKRIPSDQLDSVLKASQRIGNDALTADVLCAVAGKLTDELVSMLLEVIQAMEDAGSVAKVLTAVAPRLAGGQLGDAVKIAVAKELPAELVDGFLRGLHLENFEDAKLVWNALVSVYCNESRYPFVRFLAAAQGVLDILVGRSVVDEVVTSIGVVRRWWP